MLTMDGESRPISGLVWIRAAIALFQVVVLILAVAVPIHMSPPWDAAALAVIVVVPCIAVAGVGNVRLLPLAIWLVACTALVSGFTFLAARLSCDPSPTCRSCRFSCSCVIAQ